MVLHHFSQPTEKLSQKWWMATDVNQLQVGSQGPYTRLIEETQDANPRGQEYY